MGEELQLGDLAIMRGCSFKCVSIMERGGEKIATFHDEAQQAIEAAAREDADDLPPGTKWHVRTRLLIWIEAVSAWTVPGMMEKLSPEKIARAEAEKKAAIFRMAKEAGIEVIS